MDNPVTKLIEQLNLIRKYHGEVAFKMAAEQTVAAMLKEYPGNTEIESILRSALSEVVEFDTIKEQVVAKNEPNPQAATTNQFMAEQIRQQVPGLKTQAQFDVFMAAFDALRLYMNHTFTGQKEAAGDARKALLEALDTAVQATELSEKLGVVPEAANGPGAEAFKSSPREFTEQDQQKSLLSELQEIQSNAKLAQWYEANRRRIDEVVTPVYRNEFFDAIRAKKLELRSA